MNIHKQNSIYSKTKMALDISNLFLHYCIFYAVYTCKNEDIKICFHF